jgi:hypothetical protein
MTAFARLRCTNRINKKGSPWTPASMNPGTTKKKDGPGRRDISDGTIGKASASSAENGLCLGATKSFVVEGRRGTCRRSCVEP